MRTQISLPQDLKEKITREARQQDISMSEYLRRAAAVYEKRTKLTKARRAQIAKELRGSIKGMAGWGSMSAQEVLEDIRKDRQLSDERINRFDRY